MKNKMSVKEAASLMGKSVQFVRIGLQLNYFMNIYMEKMKGLIR